MPVELPANLARTQQFVRTLPAFRDYSVTEKIQRVQSPRRGEKHATAISIVSPAEKQFLLAGERFKKTGNTSHDRPTRGRKAVECDERIASRAHFESEFSPRVLVAHDPEMARRTWQEVMNEMATHGIATTQERCARGFRSRARSTRTNWSSHADCAPSFLT